MSEGSIGTRATDSYVITVPVLVLGAGEEEPYDGVGH
jgi:hypothetical protein